MKATEKPIIKTSIEFDERRNRFVIVCENLETLNHILNLITYATEKLNCNGKDNTRPDK